MPWFSSLTIGTETPQFKMWSEHLLVRLCQLSDQSERTDSHPSSTEAIQTFRYWAKFWDATKGSGSDAVNSATYRRLAWKAYYDTLSNILQNDLPYEAEPVPSTTEKSALETENDTRVRQRAELKRVETIYENLLIKETRFPKASDSNREIGVWIDSVIGNWRILCGPTWSSQDIGDGGKEGVGRSVLDVRNLQPLLYPDLQLTRCQILYRAATKTYHSTQILRNLFVVHASLAEFDLAFKAYDSYVEIVKRGKDRVEQTGEPDDSIDDDSTVLRTSAEAIRLLCRFGSRAEAEKAVEIGHNIEDWLHQFEHTKLASDTGPPAALETHVEPTALAIAYSAIGISQAHWAQFTYTADARAGIQAKAIRYLRKALSPTLKDSSSVETLYALAAMLAETRDIPAAIKIVKRALSPATKNETLLGTDGVLSGGLVTEFGRERKLIPLWHLLALLLTSRSEFGAAEKACEAAFAQFGDPAILFGTDDSSAYRSEHLKEANGQDTRLHGIVDRMGDFEKSGILQIKMTQLALIEVTDGALAAVDGCDELLALYGRLFGVPVAAKPKTEVPNSLAPPKSSAGTTRGSIFRGRRGSSKVAERAPITDSGVPPSLPQAGSAPAIQVTGDSNGHTHGHHHILPHHKKDGHTVGRSSSKLRKRSASVQSRSAVDTDPAPEVPPLPEGVANGTSLQSNAVSHDESKRLSAVSMPEQSGESNGTPLEPIPHNLPPTSPPQAHSTQPPVQDVRLPAPFPSASYIPPDPYFSQVQERRQKVSLLVSIWIFISGLYTRAQVYNDAREAAAEALKLIETFEAELSVEDSTAKALVQKGWGGGKSVDELWADALSTVSEERMVIVSYLLTVTARRTPSSSVAQT
jgi:tetratricopeptide (TPR) repeat protein